MFARVLFFLLALACASPASAHPHVWVTVTSELLYAPDGSVTGIRQHWTFDDMYTAMALQGQESQVKGQYTRAELAALAKLNVDSLKEFAYFTFVEADGKKLSPAEPLPGYWLEYKDEKLTLNFTLPFQPALKAKDVRIELYDPTYFVDFTLAKTDPVHFVGAPPTCKGTVQWPREPTFAEGKKLSDDPEAGKNWGANFANKIVVTCR